MCQENIPNIKAIPYLVIYSFTETNFEEWNNAVRVFMNTEAVSYGLQLEM